VPEFPQVRAAANVDWLLKKANARIVIVRLVIRFIKCPVLSL
jgi:hypothetical protein